MNIKLKKALYIAITLSLILGSCAIPPKAEARISFNRFKRVTRRIFRKVKRGTKFVVNLPDKATRWMGPVLGPVASTVLTGNIANNARWGKIFNKAQRLNKGIDAVDDVLDKQQYLQDLRNAYRNEATDLRKQANDIRESRRNLLSQLTTGDITYQDYKNHVVALNDIAEVYEATANKFDGAANRMKPEDLAGILSRNLLNTVWGEVRNAVKYETSQEISKLIDPDIIQRLINNEGVNIETVLTSFASRQVDKQLGSDEEFDADALKDRVNDRVKQILKENRDDLKENWEQKIKDIIAETKKELEEEKNKLPEVDTEKKPDKNSVEEEDTTELDDLLEPNPDSADQCKNGYEWDIKIGKCIQSNCNSESIPNAHYSYVKDCVCGSSGSMYENPDDPNQECRYSLTNKSCPGCVYACVGLKDECPEIKN